MGGACSCLKAPDAADPPQDGKATIAPRPVTAPVASAAPPEPVSRAKAATPVDEPHRLPLEAVPAAEVSQPPAAATVSYTKPDPVRDSGPCDFPVLVLPRMQRPGQQHHRRSPSAGEGYEADPHHSATSSLQQSGGDDVDMAAGAGMAPHAVIDDLPGQRSPPPLRIEPWHDSDSSSGFLGRGGGDRGSRDSMSTDGGGSFTSARSFNSTWSGSEGPTPSPRTSMRGGSRLAPDWVGGAPAGGAPTGGGAAPSPAHDDTHGANGGIKAAKAAKKKLTNGISSVSAAALHLGGGLKKRTHNKPDRHALPSEAPELPAATEPQAEVKPRRLDDSARLDAMPGAVLATSGAAGAPGLPDMPTAMSPASAHTASAAEPAQQTAAGVSARTWQTLREALAHAAEGRILTAAALLGPAAAGSGLSEAALLARLEQAAPAAEVSAQHAVGSAVQGIAAVGQAGAVSAQPFHAVANAARASASVANSSGPGLGQDGGALTAKEVARVLALPEQAAWLREGLRQFHDREGYAMARDDDLKVSYRHLKGSSVHSFRFEAIYDCGVPHLLSISREFDLMASWNRFVLNPCVLQEPTLFSSLLYTGLWMPFPLPEMDFVVKITWSDIVDEEGSLLLMMEDGIDQTDARGCQPLPERAAKRTHLRMLPGSCAVFTPLPPGQGGGPRTLCEVLSHVEPHVQHTPAFVIHFVLKVLSPFIYNATRKVLASPFFQESDSAVNRRIRDRPDVYGLIDRRLSGPAPAGIARFERRSSQTSLQRRSSKNGHQHAA